MTLFQVWRKPRDALLHSPGLNLNIAVEGTQHTLGLSAAQVASARFESNNLARTRYFETLGRGFVCLDLWHVRSTSLESDFFHE